MPLNDFSDAEKLSRDWDGVMRRNPGPNDGSALLPLDKDNVYIQTGAVKDEGTEDSCDEDENLSTAYALMNASASTADPATGQIVVVGGFEHPIAQMIVGYSESVLPHHLTRLFLGLESTRKANSWPAQELKEQIRGMVMMAYAWGYVMARTGSLSVRDESIYGELLDISAAPTKSIELRRLTQSAENRLPHTTGMLLQAIDAAAKKGQTNSRLFFQGSLQQLYALANAHFGRSAQFVGEDTL